MRHVSSETAYSIVDNVRLNGGIIPDRTARTIASWWISPSPRDRAILKVSQGQPLTSEDLSDMHDTIAENIAAAETEADRMALVALTHWVLRQQES